MTIAGRIIHTLGKDPEEDVLHVVRGNLGFPSASVHSDADRLQLLTFLVEEVQLARFVHVARNATTAATVLPHQGVESQRVTDDIRAVATAMQIEQDTDVGDVLRRVVRNIKTEGEDKWKCRRLLPDIDQLSTDEVCLSTVEVPFLFFGKGDFVEKRQESDEDTDYGKCVSLIVSFSCVWWNSVGHRRRCSIDTGCGV